jgi:hypothetical protein
LSLTSRLSARLLASLAELLAMLPLSLARSRLRLVSTARQ